MKFSGKRRINFFDCDPAGIMFYGNAFYLAHSVYEELIEQFGIDEYWTSSDYIVPIVNAQSGFNFPLQAGDEVVIEVFVTEIRDHSFELSYICRNLEGRQAFTLKTVHIFTDLELKKMKIPDQILEKLKLYSEQPL